MNIQIRKITLLLMACLTALLSSCNSLPDENPRPQHWATSVSAKHLENFYRVTDDIYRSAQPSKEGMRELEEKGIKTILNLRSLHDDRKLAQGTGLKIVDLPMMANNISQDELFNALEFIKEGEKPILVHCKHGADRTGAVIAAYRIIEQHWTKEDAIREMRRGGFSHHYLLFPNIRETINELRTDDFQPVITSRNADDLTPATSQ